MKIVGLLIFILSLISSVSVAVAQVEICRDVYQAATRNISLETRHQSYRRIFFSEHCESSGRVSQSSLGISASAIVESIPVGLDLFGSNAEEQLTNFCKTEAENIRQEDSRITFYDKVQVDALQSFNQCVALARQNFSIWHTDNHPVSATVTIRVLEPDLTLRLTGMGYDQNAVRCLSSSFGSNRDPVELHGSMDLVINGQASIFCERTRISGDGLIEYPYAPVQVQTSRGDYRFALQADGVFTSIPLVSEAGAAIAELQWQNTDLSGQLARLSAAYDVKDTYPVFVVGPRFGGPLARVGRHVRPVGCLRPDHVQRAVIADQLRLACEAGYAAELVGEISHVGGEECGYTVVQINCVRR